MRHLISPLDLSVEETGRILLLADDIIANRQAYAHRCEGKKLATLFFEPSTRTRLSFEAAMLELGGQVLGFSSASSSSASKGETVADTIRIIQNYADIIAMRHPLEGAAAVARQYAAVPVINAGDGGHLHPTQTLTDLLTIHRLKGRLDHLTVGLCGDLKFGRTVHSLIRALLRYAGVKFILVSPDELPVPDYIRSEMDAAGAQYLQVGSLEAHIAEMDVLYMTRVQQERFADPAEYQRLKDVYVLDAQKMALAKPDMIVLHPLPRVNEIALEVDADPRAVYFQQALFGKYVRMALILTLLQEAEARPGMAAVDLPAPDERVRCTNPHCICGAEPAAAPRAAEVAGGGRRCVWCEHTIV